MIRETHTRTQQIATVFPSKRHTHACRGSLTTGDNRAPCCLSSPMRLRAGLHRRTRYRKRQHTPYATAVASAGPAVCIRSEEHDHEHIGGDVARRRKHARGKNVGNCTRLPSHTALYPRISLCCRRGDLSCTTVSLRKGK